MKRYYSPEEAKSRFLGKTKLSQRKIDNCVDNINYICHRLGRIWIERIFRGLSGTAVFFSLSNIGEQLKGLKRVQRYRIMLRKIKLTRTQQELNPYLIELSIMSRFAKHKIPTYYEPILLVNGKKKAPDLKVRINNRWVYLETCAPKNIIWASLTKISNQLFRAIRVGKEYSLFLLLTRNPNLEEMGTLKSTSNKLIQQFKSGSCSRIIGDFATIVVDDSDPRIISRFIKTKKVLSSVNVCALRNHNGKTQKINLQMLFTDARAENILRKEARHFSRRTSNLIIFCMGSLGKSMMKWKFIISRRLKKSMHRRINGVFLLDSAMSGSTGRTIKKKAMYISHQDPRKPLQDTEIELIKKVLS